MSSKAQKLRRAGISLAFPKPKKSQRKAWKRDEAATNAMGFSNPKSYVDKEGHVFVSGWNDHLRMRAAVYEQAGGKGGLVTLWDGFLEYIATRPAQCQFCDPPHSVLFGQGHWCHPKRQGGKRCDGGCCCKFACGPGHDRHDHAGRMGLA